MADPNVADIVKRGNVCCFFDVAAAGTPIGRIKMELYANTVPKTVENFRQFCTGEFKKDQQPIGYKVKLWRVEVFGYFRLFCASSRLIRRLVTPLTLRCIATRPLPSHDREAAFTE